MMHEVFAATGKHVPPPPGVDPVFNWGHEEKVREFFGDRLMSLEFVPREIVWRFHSPEHMLEFFRDWYGPTQVAFEALDEEGQKALAEDLLAVYRKHNRADDGTLVAPSAVFRGDRGQGMTRFVVDCGVVLELASRGFAGSRRARAAGTDALAFADAIGPARGGA